MFDTNLADYALRISIIALPLLVALTFHEAAHGLVAYLLGDPTAKRMGRLTLNPLKHLDPLGTLIFFIANIGWAKPVPVNPNYFRQPRRDMLLVALAGPGVNILLALVFAALFHMVGSLDMPEQGSLAYNVLVPVLLICQTGVFVNLILAIFNLLPVPPLDGSNILAWLLPPRLAIQYMALARYGFFIILGLAVLAHFFNVSILGSILLPPVEFAADLLGVPLF
ncbi:MAG: site-2 protease family protein [Desulfovibrionaceae bacterium]